MYENLNLRDWPFKTVPDADFAAIWAGRPRTKNQIDRLIQKMLLVQRSALHLLWANFGMGKTHTLLHIQYLCNQTKGRLIPIYAVMPKRSTGFLELYREIVLGMPFEFLGDQLGKLSTGANSLTSHPIFRRTPGIVNALLAMKSGDFERTNIAMQWLTGKAGLSTADLKAIGVTYKINSPEEAIDSLSTLTSLATYRNNPPKKIVLMIDEYQRVGELSPRLSKENNAGLHTFFNQNPDGLELILSFSFGREDDIAFLLSDELKSRAEPQAITLDVLTRAQASEFLSDLLAKFRITKDERWAFPFSPLAINAMLMQISQLKDLTPRRIMKYANHILMEHILDNPKSSEEISDSEVLSYLEDPQLSSLDVDSDSDIASD